MKKTAYYYLSLAAIVVGGMTSCQDEDMGVDYETVKLSVYERDFLKQFGEPAPNHQWGFDKANATFKYLLTGELSDTESSGTRAVIKMDQNIVINGQNMHIADLYEKPANITQREHDEVYAWFSSHKVTWKNTPTYYQGSSTRQTTDGIAHLISGSSYISQYGSLAWDAHKDKNPLGDYSIGVDLSFHDAYVQHVNSNKNSETITMLVTGASDAQNYPGQETTTTTADKGSLMNYLYTMGLNMDGSGSTWQEHLNDFNNGSGYGWGNQSSSQNAIYVSNALIDTWTYDCSGGSSLKHDKYFIVYLEGADYSGWYLGFDYESWGNQVNERVFGDGICNDWIIKLSATTPILNPARIMCEDLGGSFDTDFNDLVYDIDIDEQHNKVTIIIRAAGGTLPVKFTYKHGGVENTICDEVHAAWGVESTVPVNVGAQGGVTKDPLTYTINGRGNMGGFTIDDVNVYVYLTDRAEWINLTLLDESSVIPCRICVPQTVKWPKELQSITLAYPGFIDWVKDPTNLFWSRWESDKQPQNEYIYQ